MKLKSIQFTQDEGKPEEWRLAKCPLGKVNLIVGKNTSGKSKTLNIIGALAKLLSRSRVLEFKSGNYKAIFDNKGKKLEYILKYEEKKVLQERLSLDSEIVLERASDGNGTIKAVEANIRHMKFQTAENQLTAVSKRDAIQHPFLEDLYNWADNLRHFYFGGQMGKDQFASFVKSDEAKDEIDLKETNKIVAIFREGKSKFGDKFLDAIKKDMSTIRYDIEDINIGPPASITFIGPIPTQPVGLIVKEADLKGETDQHMISQGMFRSLSLIIQINFAQMTNVPNCVLVDDIGEGLDYERSSSLIEVLIDKAMHTGFQLIMATNDRFVMNKVPLEFWSIIHRIKNESRFYSYSNSPQLFEKFELIGLNNFDFFSSGYFLNNQKEK